MKQVASILLLILFLFNITGYYALFFALNSENKTAIKNNICEGKHLQTMCVHKSNIKNIVFKEEGKEFVYNGEMYDIKSIIRDGDFVIFHCINDKTEKQLLAGLQTHVKNNSDSNSPPDKKQNDSTKNPVKDLFIHQNTLMNPTSSAIEFPSAICHLTSYVLPPLPSPPPEISLS
ncbi:MAG: hypothetical protein EPN85_13695 [Bacteroidetes bacterium]|nr:MAG: hypothetical protein EPN85_13695 [Bacteroidota bacterium]